MNDVSSEGVPQYRVGPDADPDRYGLGTAFSSGAEGILYRGTITTAGMTLDVAIKMLQPRFLPRVDEWHTRWAEQVELLRSLQVPGVVPVRDGFLGPLPHPPKQVGEGQTLYLVMNWVEGESLDEWIRHRPDRNPIDDLKVLVGVAAALDLMHSGRATGGVPVVHRDIKPANILVTELGSVLVDFGLTRGLPDGQRLTGVVGTPGYLAPESLEAGSYGPASDRYAFGAVAYFVLTGSEPPAGHQPDAMRASLAAVPELADRPEVTAQVMKMLASDPDDRPPGVANWVGQLRRSSLEAGPDILNPAAPQRNPTSPSGQKAHHSLIEITRRPIAIPLALLVLAVLVLSGFAIFGRGAPSTAEYSDVAGHLTLDPSCGRDSPSPFPTASVPVAVASWADRSAVGANAADDSAQSPSNELMTFDACTGTGSGSLLDPPSGKATLADLSARSNVLYAVGYNSAGWIVARYLREGSINPSFDIDRTFGVNGYSTIGTGKAYAISVTPSGEVLVLGSDEVRALNSNGSVDTFFGTRGVITTRYPLQDPTMSITDDGRYLLVGGSEESGGACANFFIWKYQVSSGLLVQNFGPSGSQIVGYGLNNGANSTSCRKLNNVAINNFASTELSSILPLPNGAFVAVGAGLTSNASAPQTITGRGAFLCWHYADGKIDDDIQAQAGIVEIRSPSVTKIEALAEPDGGIVTALAENGKFVLRTIAPSGMLGGTTQVSSPNGATTFAMADEGDGKILVVSANSDGWMVSLFRYT